ncbi:UvrD-helicase domain-containing protein [Caballeronia novacaledonica]|uniref:UvrD-helicase domain-containing protein n=1 Tax=Caballeronia novacaledonica TaxID=1544861 RepID=UPI001EE17E2F|nr:UvrD-helicase domain-containing protein [Caballeronia novacaledonica]GJH12664.1 UvrD-helicase domain-containing protein [Caballeronia novacaledonica]
MLEATVAQMMASRGGAIEAPAGTGKTEQIALVARHVPGRWLILTHTVAGVDAIRRRLRRLSVPADKWQVDTLSAWAHRYAMAYPDGSGLARTWSARDRDWPAVIRAAATLIERGAINSVLRASYTGVLVDEYQDCTRDHHRLVCALAGVLRCYVFGDPLQAIFGFRAEEMADWDKDTLTRFPLAGRLETPHRWIAAGNAELGNWLIAGRADFRAGRFDFTRAPESVSWTRSEQKAGANELAQHCSVRMEDGHTLSVLHSSVSDTRRADLAKLIRATTVEPVGGQSEREFYRALRDLQGMNRMEAALTLAGTVYSGADVSGKRKRVDTLLKNTNRMRIPASPAELALRAVAQGNSLRSVADFFSCLEREFGVTVVRPELSYCVGAALRHCIEHPDVHLDDAAFQIANARRERGRIIRNRSVGSTLLVKGLEFDHVVITPDACTSRQNWYVALTRASRSVKVLSPKARFTI